MKHNTVKVEGLISRKVIKYWLENFDRLTGGYKLLDHGRGTPINRDGISGNRLNSIMLEDAIKDLPPVLKVCMSYRWLEQLPLDETLSRTGIPRSTYYRRCDKAIDFIYYHVNGLAANYKDLAETILK